MHAVAGDVFPEDDVGVAVVETYDDIVIGFLQHILEQACGLFGQLML